MIKKILIIDDSPISRKMIKSCIPKDRGYELFEAGDGLAGFELFKQIGPDVTFMDLTMPVMDGIKATEEILHYDKKAVIVVCTADIQLKSIKKILETGAFTLVKKPPTKESIEDALTRVEIKG